MPGGEKLGIPSLVATALGLGVFGVGDGMGWDGTHGVLDDHKVALVFVGDAQVVEERVGRLPHHHGAEELASEPGAAAGRDAGFHDGDLEVRSLLAEHVGGAQAAGPGADDDDVGFGVVVEVGEVTARCLGIVSVLYATGADMMYAACWGWGRERIRTHSARDLRLADGSKRE